MTTPRTLVTCALPYANGPIHLGHMVEHIQTDIFVRFLRSCGEEVVFLCADDTHGAPIELNAMKQGVTPEQFVAKWATEHQADFRDFGISFDHYGSTNSAENKQWAEQIYNAAKAAGSIGEKEVEQPYDEKAGRWLSDRFIRGTCPNCKTPDQYGDACENCNATYNPRELLDARSAISGEPLTWKKSNHAFFLLSKHADFLKAQISNPTFMNPGPASQLGEFFSKGLADWDITRDGPYFGFQIPGRPNQFFYVWLDAPIGYISATEQWAKKNGKRANDYWDAKAPGRIVHVIGKDIVYFHCLFWPAVLKVANLKVPDRVHIHGHLTVDGAKMSKTRGTFINARPYLDKLDPAYLRFYYASLLGSGPEDLDFNLKDFPKRVSAELVNNLCNLANRTLALLAKPELGGKLAAPDAALGSKLVGDALARLPEIRAGFGNFDHRAAVKTILEIGYAANQFLTQNEPWKVLAKDPEKARASLSEAAEIVYLLTALLDPVVPTLADKLATQLGRPKLSFATLKDAKYPLLDRTAPIGTPGPLINRLEEDQVKALIQPTEAPVEKKAPAPAAGAAAKKAAAPAAEPGEIEYDDFAKVVLKVGRVLAAEKVEKADKLLKLTVDLGEDKPRTIVSGIALAFTADQVVNKNVVVVANLKSKPLRGIDSHGMLLAAGPGGKELTLVDPGPLAPGTVVK